MAIFEQPVEIKSNLLRFSGTVTPSPPVSPSGVLDVWFDRANGQLKFSVSGGAFGSNPSAIALQDLSAHILTTAPTASAAAALMRLDSGSGGSVFAGSANGTVLGINLGSGSADLLNLQKAGAARFSVSEAGIATGLKSVYGGATTSLGTATIHATDAATIPVVIRVAASQTADAWQVQDNGGTARVAISDLTTTTEHTLTLKGIPSQTGHLLACQVDDGTTMFAVEHQSAANFVSSIALGGNTKFREQSIAIGGQDRTVLIPKGSVFDVLNQAANAFQLHVTAAGVALYANANGTARFTVTEFAATLADAVNFVLNTTTGTKIGTATGQKLGFWNATPVIQPASANQAALTDSTTGTADGTVDDVGAAFSQATLNNNFADIIRLVNQLRADLVTIGAIKGAA